MPITYTPTNGWTKAKILEQLDERMPDEGAAMRNDNCCYLTEDGKTCAAGAFIPPEFYREQWDAMQLYIYKVSSQVPELKDHMPLNMNGLILLQEVHDAWATAVSGKPQAGAYHEELRNRYGSAKAACMDWVENNVTDDYSGEETS